MKQKIKFSQCFFSSFLANFAIITGVFYLYYPTRGAGFAFDTFDWFYDYKTHPNFNYFSPDFDATIRPVYHFLLSNLLSKFQLNPTKWYLVFVILFCATLILYQIWIKKLFEQFDISNGKNIALLSTLFIAFSPFCTEIVVWYCTIHYHIVFLCLFSILILLSNIEHSSIFRFLLIHFLFIIALFSIELAYSIIPIAIVYALIIKYYQKTFISWNKLIYGLIIPLLSLFLVYNLVLYFEYDRLLGHYKIFKYQKDIIYSFTHFTLILSKLLFLPNFFGEKVYTTLFEFIIKYQYYLFLVFLVLIYIVYRFKKRISLKLNPLYGFYSVLITGVLSTYATISFLFFHIWKEIELDRLMVGMMFFIVPTILHFFLRIQNNFIRYTLPITYFLLGFLLLSDYTHRWTNASKIRNSYLDNMPISDTSRIYILSSPVVYKFAYINSINDSNELPKALFVAKNRPTTSSRYIIPAYYNMNLLDDVVTAKKLNDSTLQCDLRNWGTWYWRTLALGLTKYENSFIKVTPINSGLSYSIVFRKLQHSDRFFLFNQLQFHEVEWRNAPDGTLFL